MAYSIAYVDNLDGTLAHCKMVDAIKTLALANGWSTVRDVSTATSREIILKGVGLTGLEEIYVGFKTYHDVSADYYNILVGGFTGYVAGSTFETQPGARLSGVPAHNQRIDYWLIVNQQRIAGAMKVGTPVYESFYVGKFFQYCRPSQYPYPLAVGGALTGAAAIRFSETTHAFPYRGGANARLGVRSPAGWVSANTQPYDNSKLCGSTYQLRDTGSVYHLMPVELYSTGNLWGALDGVFHVTGFNNAAENTLVIGGITYVVIQDVARTGHADYYAMRMQ